LCKKIKNFGRTFYDFLSAGGVGEYAPTSQFFQVSASGELGKIGACEGTQAVLAKIHGKGSSLFRHCGNNYKLFRAMLP